MQNLHKTLLIDSLVYGVKALCGNVRLVIIALALAGICAAFFIGAPVIGAKLYYEKIYNTEHHDELPVEDIKSLQNIFKRVIRPYQKRAGNFLSVMSEQYQVEIVPLSASKPFFYGIPLYLALVLIFFAITVIGFLYIGGVRIALQVYDAGESSVRNLFKTSHLLPGIINVYLYVLLFALGTILFIIPGLIVMSRFALGLWFVIDHNAGPFAALRLSWHATREYAWETLGLALFFFWVNCISGVLPLVMMVIGLFAWSFVYRKIGTRG